MRTLVIIPLVSAVSSVQSLAEFDVRRDLGLERSMSDVGTERQNRVRTDSLSYLEVDEIGVRAPILAV